MNDDIRLHRAQEAQRLLEDPILNEVLDAIRQAALDELMNTPIDIDMDLKRTVMIERMKAVEALRQGLRSLIDAQRNATRPSPVPHLQVRGKN
jgi:hypothetical protein